MISSVRLVPELSPEKEGSYSSMVLRVGCVHGATAGSEGPEHSATSLQISPVILVSKPPSRGCQAARKSFGTLIHTLICVL